MVLILVPMLIVEAMVACSHISNDTYGNDLDAKNS